MSSSVRESVKVAVRLRPLSSKETQYKEIIDIDHTNASVFITNPQGSKVQFTYDFAFPPSCTQEEVYDLTSAPIVAGALEGFNGTIFAYGQTGTGKTHTMDGDEEGDSRGIVPRAFEHIFEYIKVKSDTQTFAVQIQYIEIYNEAIRDLLAEKEPTGSLVIREDPEKGFYVADVTIREVKSIQELFRLQSEGKRRRKTRKTGMNDESSRSHSVLTLTIETLMVIEGRQHVRTARLNLVDLAGSERVAKTGAEGQGFVEGVSINYALMVLGNCISALTSRGHSHIPYRDSSLTKLLRDSLGGNARTLMIATLGPADYNFSESMSTLRYAENAKKIKNKPKVNMDPKDALLLQLKEEKEALESQLRGSTPEQQQADREAKIKELEAVHEREKKRLTEESHLAAEERTALEGKLELQRQEIEKEKSEQVKFAGRLKELSKFLAKGSDKLKEKTQKNEAEIAAIRAKLERREQRAKQIQQQLEEKKLKKQQMMDQCTTIQGKVQMVSEKFKEAVAEYGNMKAKIPEVEKTIQQDREQLAGEIDSLNRQLELYSLILENFVPQSEVQRIRSSAVFDEDRETWEVPEADKRSLVKKVIGLIRPNSAISAPRPTATVRVKSGAPTAIDDVPALELRPTPVESRLKDGPKIIDMNGIEEEIEEQFRDDEADLVVEIPQELPGIPPTQAYASNLSIVRSAMR